MQVDHCGTVRGVAHAFHQLSQVRARAGGVVVPGVAQVVEVHACGGHLADCGAAACRALPGGSPTGAAPHAGQLARTRRPVAQALTPPGDRARVSDRAVLLAPGILSPRKDHRQGRTSSLRCGRSTLTLIFPGKSSAPIGRTDQTRLVLSPLSLGPERSLNLSVARRV
jgi:hypothetical protein